MKRSFGVIALLVVSIIVLILAKTGVFAQQETKDFPVLKGDYLGRQYHLAWRSNIFSRRQ